jgi:hypothetical protein
MLRKRASRCRERGQQDAEEANQMQRRTIFRETEHRGVAREEIFVEKCKGKIGNKLLNKHI